MWTLITISFSLYLYFKALKLHGTHYIDTTWQQFAHAQTTYEQISTFSLTSQTTAIVVFQNWLGMEALDTTKLKLKQKLVLRHLIQDKLDEKRL